jgi:hypothetical protein
LIGSKIKTAALWLLGLLSLLAMLFRGRSGGTSKTEEMADRLRDQLAAEIEAERQRKKDEADAKYNAAINSSVGGWLRNELRDRDGEP